MGTFISTGVIAISLGSQYALISIGFTLIFGIMGVVNFAHGAFYVLGGYCAFALSQTLGIPFFEAVLLATVATAILGYIIEVFILEKYVADHMSTMLLTLGISQIAITLITIGYGAEPVDFPFPISGSLRWGGYFVPKSHGRRVGCLLGRNRGHLLPGFQDPVRHRPSCDGR